MNGYLFLLSRVSVKFKVMNLVDHGLQQGLWDSMIRYEGRVFILSKYIEQVSREIKGE